MLCVLANCYFIRLGGVSPGFPPSLGCSVYPLGFAHLRVYTCVLSDSVPRVVSVDVQFSLTTAPRLPLVRPLIGKA